MIRLIKYLILAAIALVLVVLALANREPVTLELLPAELAGWAGLNYAPIEMPLRAGLPAVPAGTLTRFDP